MTRTELRQSVGYMSFFTSLAAAAIVTWTVWKLSIQPMNYIGDNAQLSIVLSSKQWTETLLNNLPAIFLIMAVAGSIAFVVYQTRFV